MYKGHVSRASTKRERWAVGAISAWPRTMNKRTFFRLFASMIASPITAPLFAWASKSKLTNWAGNLEYSTDRLYSASSLEQVRSYVKEQSRLKVLGTRHCFNNI